jgi:hypothetical protein
VPTILYNDNVQAALLRNRFGCVVRTFANNPVTGDYESRDIDLFKITNKQLR